MFFSNQENIDLYEIEKSNKRIIIIFPPENNETLILFRTDVKKILEEEELFLEDLFRIYSITNSNLLPPICMNNIRYIKNLGFCEVHKHEMIPHNIENFWQLTNYCCFIIQNYDMDDLKRTINWINQRYEFATNKKQQQQQTFNIIEI